MGAREKRNSIGQPVPELPVADVERAQQHYRDALGGGGSRRSNLPFTGCSLKISMRHTRN